MAHFEAVIFYDFGKRVFWYGFGLCLLAFAFVRVQGFSVWFSLLQMD